MKSKNTFIHLIFLSLVAITLMGCAFGNKGSFQYTRTTTVGQELQDLEKVKSTLTDEEYQKLRKQILKGGPFPPMDHEKWED